jgi:NADP-dependent 3-hydroxy acid dehydrogenase YdfG
MELKGKTALITGASSGIGDATARALASAGVRVALLARRSDRLETLKTAIRKGGGEALVTCADVTKKGEVKKAVDVCLNTFGNINILINNAGIMPLSLMKNLHEEEWERMVDVNIKGVLFCIGAVLPGMIKQASGHIINISSVAGRKLFPGSAVYCATKFAVSALSEGLRMELGPASNIRVTVIEPGMVATELGLAITDKEVFTSIGAMFQNVKALKADDIAHAVLYALGQPDNVNAADIMIMPTSQG